ncbi:MAG: flagellar biosynthesis protein FlhB [Deltaproteobacteria bacterium]|nr:MAG: flagellar biosynthesis protein FlhB [Deltaproteobacteria bacterium]
MAEDNMQEKTEEATPKKLEKAREEGQVGKSIEVPSVFVLMAGVTTLFFFSRYMYDIIVGVMFRSFSFDTVPGASMPWFINRMYMEGKAYVLALIPLMLAVVVLALASNYMQVGFLLSWKAIQPKASRINPINGFKQKFSSRSVVELLKSILKIIIIAVLTYAAVSSEFHTLVGLSGNSVAGILIFMLKVVFKMFIWILIAMLVLALFDLIFQKWKYAQDQKMTKQEVKDEFKQTEGDPQIKSRIRAIQMQAARRRMMQAVPEADVVVTNPVHLALALKYDALTMQAPKVLAKGAGPVADRIKALAAEHSIPVVENVALARNLYKSVDIDEEVPSELYQAVAELLAYVYRMKGKP